MQASLYPPHFQPLVSLGFKQMKQNSLPHRHFMCLQARTCSISMPQDTHARRVGQPTTPTISFLGQFRRILRRLSSPEQTRFPGEKIKFRVSRTMEALTESDALTQPCSRGKRQCERGWPLHKSVQLNPSSSVSLVEN